MKEDEEKFRTEVIDGKTIYHCEGSSRCKKIFTSKKFLYEHIEFKHQKDFRPCECEFCDQTFTDFFSLKKHSNKIHPDGEVKCEICGERVDSNRKLEKHKFMKHDEKKCSNCGELLKGGRKLRLHRGNCLRAEVCGNCLTVFIEPSFWVCLCLSGLVPLDCLLTDVFQVVVVKSPEAGQVEWTIQKGELCTAGATLGYVSGIEVIR